MPKIKEPRTLEKLAVECLGQRTVEAIRSRSNINSSSLHDYLYAELPDVLSQEVTVHMLTEVSWNLIQVNGLYRQMNVRDSTKTVLVAIVGHDIRVLDLTANIPEYAVETLCCNIQTFQKLHTLILKHYFLPADVVETLATGLSSLKFLAHFQMPFRCTDTIIVAIGTSCFATIEHIDVRFSKLVTDASFMALLECRELTHFAICDTSMTAEGFVEFLQHRKCDDTAKDVRGLGVGSEHGWDVSSTHLNAIALCCPMLKYLEIFCLRADMEELVSLSELEALSVDDGQFDQCNLGGLLRVRGCNITLLELYSIEPLDLACILNHCVNIRRLYVRDCSTTMGDLETAPKPCQFLETLLLYCKFSPSSIEGVLYACVNLTTLSLFPSEEHVTDELILRVLSRNPLQKLTSFSASCRELTMRAVDAIVDQCPLLEKLLCTDCDRLTEADVVTLLQKIEDGNLDLFAGFSAMHFPW